MCVHEEVLAALVFKIIDFGAFPSFGCLTSHFGDFWGLFDLDIEWNVTPLLGHFGGRAGFCISLQSSTILRITLSLLFYGVALSFLLSRAGFEPVAWGPSASTLSTKWGDPTVLM